MSERADSVAESANKVAPEENTQPKGKAPPYQDLEAGRPSLPQTAAPTSPPTPPVATPILIRFLTVVGYCFIVALCTMYGYTKIRYLTLHDGSSTLANALYSSMVGGTVLGVLFARDGGVLDKYFSRWKLCNIHLACGRLCWSALEFLLCTFLTLLMCWSALTVGFCVQKAPIILTEHPDIPSLLTHMAYDWYTSLIGVLSLSSITSMVMVWFLVKEPKISHNLEGDRSKLIVVGCAFFHWRGNSLTRLTALRGRVS